jgi:hypothetical protein
VSRALGHDLHAEVPADWEIRDADGLVEIEPPNRNGTAHISVLRRTAQTAPDAGDALDLLARLPVWRDRETSTEPVERFIGGQLCAFESCVGPEGNHWDVGARVASRRALVFTFNAPTSESSERDAARTIFFSIVGLDS